MLCEAYIIACMSSTVEPLKPCIKKIRHTTMTPKLPALNPPPILSKSAHVRDGQMQSRYQPHLSSTECHLGRLQTNLMTIHILAHPLSALASQEPRARKRSSYYIADKILIFSLVADYPGEMPHIMSLVNRQGQQ